MVILCVCGIVCIGDVIAAVIVIILIAFIIATTTNVGICGTRLKELVLKDGAKELVCGTKELGLKAVLVLGVRVL